MPHAAYNFHGRRYLSEHWTEEECALAEDADEEIRDCECHYMAPYGFVVAAGCEKHD